MTNESWDCSPADASQPASLLRDFPSSDPAPTEGVFCKAGRAAAQSAFGALESTTHNNAHQAAPTRNNRFDLVRRSDPKKLEKRISIGSGLKPQTHQTHQSPSRPAQRRITIGFGPRQPQPEAELRESVGHTFPTRDEVKEGRTTKKHGKADFAVSSDQRQRAQRRSSLAHQHLAAQAKTKSQRSFSSYLDLALDLATEAGQPLSAPTLKKSPSTEECVSYANQSIRRNSSDYRSHVEYYRPQLQLNKYSAIKQGCAVKEDVKDMTKGVQASTYNQKSNPHHSEKAAPQAHSTLHYIMMNTSGLKETADFYRNWDTEVASMEFNTDPIPTNRETKEEDLFAKMHRRTSNDGSAHNSKAAMTTKNRSVSM